MGRGIAGSAPCSSGPCIAPGSAPCMRVPNIDTLRFLSALEVNLTFLLRSSSMKSGTPDRYRCTRIFPLVLVLITHHIKAPEKRADLSSLHGIIRFLLQPEKQRIYSSVSPILTKKNSINKGRVRTPKKADRKKPHFDLSALHEIRALPSRRPRLEMRGPATSSLVHIQAIEYCHPLGHARWRSVESI